MYGLKMCLRNVRHPSRTRRFWYYIRVLFIVGILLLCALELKICLGVKYPPPQLPANVAKKLLPGQGLTFIGNYGSILHRFEI